MTNQKKSAVAVTAGLVGVLALGACSSGTSDQAQDANSPSASQSEAPREAAGKKVDNSKNVTVAPPKDWKPSEGWKFNDVVVTHAPQTKCTRTEEKDNKQEDALFIRCTRVVTSWFGDSVYVRLPDSGYSVDVSNDTGGSSRMRSTLRDYAAFSLDYSNASSKVWSAPDISTVDKGWAVGVDARFSAIDVTIIVMKY